MSFYETKCYVFDSAMFMICMIVCVCVYICAYIVYDLCTYMAFILVRAEDWDLWVFWQHFNFHWERLCYIGCRIRKHVQKFISLSRASCFIIGLGLVPAISQAVLNSPKRFPFNLGATLGKLLTCTCLHAWQDIDSIVTLAWLPFTLLSFSAWEV